MNIRFVSSLTPDDEDRLAPGLVTALGQLLDAVPIAYTLRIETASGRLYQHAHAGPDVVGGVSLGGDLPESSRPERPVSHPRSEVS